MCRFSCIVYGCGHKSESFTRIQGNCPSGKCAFTDRNITYTNVVQIYRSCAALAAQHTDYNSGNWKTGSKGRSGR
jgi:hypothetical protein